MFQIVEPAPFQSFQPIFEKTRWQEQG